MSLRSRLLLPLLAALGAAAPALAQASPVPAVRGVGLNNIGADTPLKAIDADLDQARALGANTVRVEISWAALEPEQQFRLEADYLARIDRLVAGAHERHIKPLLLLLRSAVLGVLGARRAGVVSR